MFPLPLGHKLVQVSVSETFVRLLWLLWTTFKVVEGFRVSEFEEEFWELHLRLLRLCLSEYLAVLLKKVELESFGFHLPFAHLNLRKTVEMTNEMLVKTVWQIRSSESA